MHESMRLRRWPSPPRPGDRRHTVGAAPSKGPPLRCALQWCSESRRQWPSGRGASLAPALPPAGSRLLPSGWLEESLRTARGYRQRRAASATDQQIRPGREPRATQPSGRVADSASRYQATRRCDFLRVSIPPTACGYPDGRGLPMSPDSVTRQTGGSGARTASARHEAEIASGKVPQ
jgi:hypothetical protein